MEIQNQKVVWGNPVSLHYSASKQDDKESFADLSSLSWMQAAASDIVNRRYFLLELFIA